jgi:tetratricopeptide (TPR) repeat protein
MSQRFVVNSTARRNAASAAKNDAPNFRGIEEGCDSTVVLTTLAVLLSTMTVCVIWCLQNKPHAGYQFYTTIASAKHVLQGKSQLNDDATPAQNSKANAVSETSPAPALRHAQSRRRWIKLLVIGVSLLPFLLLEIGLRVFGVAAEEAELHAGFGDTLPLFELDESGKTYRTSVAKGQFFVTEKFPAEPVKNEFRIFVLGGSTVQGRPFSIETSFAKWLEIQLNAEDASRTYRSINCGGISYASYRLRPVLREVLDYKPDMIILATGHNEFLEDRTYADMKSRSSARLWLENASSKLRTVLLVRRLFGGAPREEPTEDTRSTGEMDEVVETRLDDKAGYASYRRDPEWHAQVAQQFVDSVSDMVQTCKAANVPVVLVNLGANLRDCPPFKSELSSRLSVEQQQQWQELFELATLKQQKSWEDALALYQQLLVIDDQHPLIHFRIGRCQDQLGMYQEAAISYQRALDNDVCPLRMPKRLHQTLAEIAAATNVPLVDAESAVAASTGVPNEIPGYDLYLDHVHPTIGGHQVIADKVVNILRQHNLAGAKQSSGLTAVERRALYRSHLRSLPTAYFSNGRRRIGWLEGWAQRKRLYDETIPVDSIGEVSATLRYLQLTDLDRAREHLLVATGDPDGALKLLNSAALLFQQGQTVAAHWVLSELEDVAADRFQDSVDLAKLIIACEERNTTAVKRIYELHDVDLPLMMAADQSTWANVMPDVIERAKKQIGK